MLCYAVLSKCGKVKAPVTARGHLPSPSSPQHPFCSRMAGVSWFLGPEHLLTQTKVTMSNLLPVMGLERGAATMINRDGGKVSRETAFFPETWKTGLQAGSRDGNVANSCRQRIIMELSLWETRRSKRQSVCIYNKHTHAAGYSVGCHWEMLREPLTCVMCNASSSISSWEKYSHH